MIDANTVEPMPDIWPPHDVGEDREAPVLADLLLTRSALRQLPKPEPLIDNVLDQGTVALLYGKWGTYKSFIALDWAASVATGRAWQGRPTEQRRVLYIAAEGAFGLNGRIDAWEQGWRTTIHDGDSRHPAAPGEPHQRGGSPQPGRADRLGRLQLHRPRHAGPLHGRRRRKLGQRLRRGGRRAAPAARAHPRRPRRRTRRSPHRQRRQNVPRVLGVRGRRRHRLLHHPDGAAVILDREKRKDGPQVDSHRLQLDLIDGTESGVIGVSRGHEQSGQTHKLLTTFVHNFATTGASKADLRAVADMSPATFHRAINALLQSGDLINTGTDKRPFYTYQFEKPMRGEA